MKTYLNPERSKWEELTQRPILNTERLKETVSEVLSQVKSQGDKALKYYTKTFDRVDLQNLEVTIDEMEASKDLISDDLKTAIKLAYDNIKNFHASQVLNEEEIETMPGVVCWRKSVGIEKVGLYIPGGTAPLFSTILMLGIPAQLAGCIELIMCTPPNENGLINPAILYTAQLVGVTSLFKVGGAQARMLLRLKNWCNKKV